MGLDDSTPPYGTAELGATIKTSSVNFNEAVSGSCTAKRVSCCYGFGPREIRGPQYQEWCVRNRLAVGGGDRPLLDAGHAYDQILVDWKDEFAQHPEYLAEVNGKRLPVPEETKFCVSNPELR